MTDADRPVAAVLFDIDDTLVDFRSSAAAGIAMLLADAGELPGLAERWQELTETHYPRFLARAVSFGQMQIERLTELLAWAGLPAVGPQEMADLEHRRQLAMTQNYRLFDDVAPCLEALDAMPWLRLGALSNSDGPHQRAKLASVGLGDRFDPVVVSGDVGVAKPDPRIFAAACEQLALRPDQVVYVGDRRDIDAAAACAAGLRGVWIDRAHAHPVPAGAGAPGTASAATGEPAPVGDSEQPDDVVTIRTLTDLPAWLTGLAGR